MKRSTIWVMAVMLLLCIAFPVIAQAAIAGNTPTDMIRITNNTRVRVRTEPDGDSKPLGWADSGMEFPYLATIDDWYCIDFEGRVGYVFGTLGSVVPGDSGAKYVTITNPNGVNIRGKASSASNQVGKADSEDIFLYMGTENGWYKINCCGRIGYVSTRLSEVSGSKRTSISASSKIDSSSAYSLVGSVPTDYVVITNNTRINVRKEPDGSAAKLGSAEPGSRYKYLGTVSSWNIVEYNGAIGYISQNLCKIEREYDSKAYYAVVINPYACNVRAGASEAARQIGKADQWDTFLCMGSEGDWYKVFYNGGVGYMSARLTVLTDGTNYYTILE